MKSRWVIVVAFLLPTPLEAQQISGRISTSVYGWERFDSAGRSEKIFRGYQTLQFDAQHHTLSLHTNLLGASTASGRFGGEDALVRLSSAFLKLRRLGDILDLNVGRIPVFAGVGTGTVDGAVANVTTTDKSIFATLYGGANVRPSLKSTGFDNLDNNFLVGGQIAYRLSDGGGRIGVSYVHRRTKPGSYIVVRPDSLFNPVLMNVDPASRSEQLGGVDATVNWDKRASLYVRYDYDIGGDRVTRAEGSLRASLMDNLIATATAIHRNPRIPSQSFFSLLPFESNTEYEGGMESSIHPSLRLFGRFAYVSYSNAASRRLTLGLNTRYASLRYSGVNGYAGEMNSVSIDAMYPFLGRQLVPTFGFSYTRYRQDKRSSLADVLAGTAGAAVHLSSAITLNGQLQWLRTTLFENDVRVFGKVSYWFNHDFSSPAVEEGRE